MSFVGTYEVTKRDNYDEFAAATGATPDQIEKGRKVNAKTEITKDGDTYTVKRIFPNTTTTNTFKLGVETELNFVGDKKAKGTITMEDGKMVVKGENFKQVSEFVGEELKETLTFKEKTMIRYSKKTC